LLGWQHNLISPFFPPFLFAQFREEAENFGSKALDTTFFSLPTLGIFALYTPEEETDAGGTGWVKQGIRDTVETMGGTNPYREMGYLVPQFSNAW
jgi:hypothetical protein